MIKIKWTLDLIDYMLKTGEPALVGPFSGNRQLTSRVVAYNQQNGTRLKLTQKKVFVIDPKTAEITTMYVVRLVSR